MARSDLAAPELAGTPERGSDVRRGHAWLGGKGVLLAVAVLGLLGVVLTAVVHEAWSPRRPATAAVPPNPFAPPRPALTPGEEAYAQALWKIHNDVKLSAVEMTFAGLAYKTDQIDRAKLKARVDAARDVYVRAEIRARDLKPPPSLRDVHANYLDAIRLYRRSAVEMARVYEDGRDQHLLAAYPLSEAAARKLLEVGDVLWPGEYVPN